MKKLLVLSLAAVLAACAHNPPNPDPGPSCDDAPLSDEVKDPTVGLAPEVVDPTLIGGRPANPAEWPASVYASANGARCSATVVGPKSVAIAAHCVGDGQSISFTAGANRYSARCTHMPEYRSNSTADWAMCLVSQEVTGVPFEVIDVGNDGVPLAIGDEVQLTGYGCTNPGGGGGNDGTFRIGEANVTRLPSGSNYDTVTTGKAALCFGDSGGAMYCKKNGKRRLCGINSRGDIRTTSYLSSTFVPKHKAWIEKWASANGAEVCGVTPNARGCRDSGPAPLPSEFSVSTKAAKVQGKMNAGFEPKRAEACQAVKKALESVE